MSKYAVVLFNLGGPDSLNAVEPFLYKLFSDPDIFNIPFLKEQFAALISRARAPKVKKQYELIGGSSPINCWTELQRRMLEEELRQAHPGTDVFIGMRYWRPLIQLAAEEISYQDYDKIILLPLYPHFSKSTTGSSFNEWNRHYKGPKEKLLCINNFCTNQKYIDAVNHRIDEALYKFPAELRQSVTIVFSAHGVPVSYIKKGDPYKQHINSTIEAVMQSRNHSHEYFTCFQSKVGPVKWLEPSTENTLTELGLSGKKNLLVVPISFVSDHIETLYEIDIEYQHVAKRAGVKYFVMTQGLNDSPIFIEALKEIAMEAIG